MTIRSYLEKADYFQIKKYSSHSNYSKECVAFSGAPRKHPHEPDKLILIPLNVKVSQYITASLSDIVVA